MIKNNIKVAGKNTVYFVLLDMIVGGIMAGTLGVVYCCWEELLKVAGVFFVINLISLIPVFFSKSYENSQGWHTGILCLFLGFEIATNFVVCFPIKEMIYYILIYLIFIVAMCLGIVYYRHREKNKENIKLNRFYEKAEMMVISLLVIMGGLLSYRKGSVILNAIAKGGQKILVLWFVFIFVGCLMVFVGGICIATTLYKTRRKI